MIHLRVVSPPDITEALLPALRAEPAVRNLIVLRSAVSRPDGDAVHFDVSRGAADDVVGRLRHLGVEQHGSIALENVAVSLSAIENGDSARGPALQQLKPVWTEVEARIRLGGSYPPSWFASLVIAGLIGAVGILTNSEILVVGALVLAFGSGSEAWGSTLQLLLNLTVLIAVTIVGLPAQRALWRRATGGREPGRAVT
jgi:hypothetical protein